ncbi:replicative helicase loader/inhibitor [Tissierella carlieri]|uniref:Replicative helicase loader/inhibitor n=1 Tax=Tissierella carlieri TaxID=689904 RepID=A0ABT1S533_9FIRM|nr:replicative helicase loader/inhibitor [Tissierella carlieri]MCQ4921578.1 replicative helicase loader/inhibitor [Tissierella carlieri]
MIELEGLMKRSDVIKLLAVLSEAYPNIKEIETTTVEIWYDCLKDVDLTIALAARKTHS